MKKIALISLFLLSQGAIYGVDNERQPIYSLSYDDLREAIKAVPYLFHTENIKVSWDKAHSPKNSQQWFWTRITTFFTILYKRATFHSTVLDVDDITNRGIRVVEIVNNFLNSSTSSSHENNIDDISKNRLLPSKINEYMLETCLNTVKYRNIE